MFNSGRGSLKEDGGIGPILVCETNSEDRISGKGVLTGS